MRPIDSIVIIFLIWIGAIIGTAGAVLLVKEFSYENRTARRHERDWKRLKKKYKQLGRVCPSRECSNKLSDSNYYFDE